MEQDDIFEKYIAGATGVVLSISLYPMLSPTERLKQKISTAYGNGKLSDSSLTKKGMEQTAYKMLLKKVIRGNSTSSLYDWLEENKDGRASSVYLTAREYCKKFSGKVKKLSLMMISTLK